MEITNKTEMPAELWVGTFPLQSPCLAAVVKATYSFGKDIAPSFSDEQYPVFFADQPYEKLEYPSAILECDMVPFKPRTDIVLLGRAYSPGGRPAKALDAVLSVGKLQKTIRVIGNRTWGFGAMGPVPSQPEPFETMDLVYERAYGGTDQLGGEVFALNRIGCGFFAKEDRESLEGAPLPNLTEPGQEMPRLRDRPDPVGFAFYPRSNAPRLQYLGTIDDEWSRSIAPELPRNFNPAFYNGAHPSLQLEGYLQGNEQVEIRNLTPEGSLRFTLPGVRPSVRIRKYEKFLFRPGEEPGESAKEPGGSESRQEAAKIREEILEMKLDTLVLLPEDRTFYLVWRGRTELRSLDTFASEVAEVEVDLEGSPMMSSSRS
jgi:hypothetical protein